ncbi:MAG: von Willebrand factor, type, partial [Ramlibacter sp.]|nr:von Willebrand factor, type [Ramlibacter sp.]
MTMTLHAVRRLIEAFVALMVGAGIPVRWGGIAGVSAAGEIHLPRPVTGEADEVALLTRLAVHEAGHIVHTQAGWDARLTGPERAIFNALEDPRMERAQCLNYPGAAIVLARGLDEMLQEIEQHVATRLATHPERAMQLELLIRGFLLLAPHEPVLRHAPALLATLAPALGPIQHR